MYLNESSSTNEPEDFFKEMYSDSGMKRMTIWIFFFGSILGIILPVGIIWYERNGYHNYRTVLNQLFSTVAWITISYIVLVYIPEGIRYLIGPLPSTFCDLHHFLKNFLVCCFMLLFDGIICLIVRRSQDHPGFKGYLDKDYPPRVPRVFLLSILSF